MDHRSSAPPRTAVLFPGQGSQAPGMGRALLERWPESRARLHDLSGPAGTDLEALLCGEEPSSDPVNVHLTMVVHGILAWEGLRRDGLPEPAMVAGHSLGEITALACAGALSAEQALRLAATRGRLLAEACAACPGGMQAFVGAPLAAMERWIEEWIQAGGHEERLWIANINGPRQLVAAGRVETLREVAHALRNRDVRGVPLATAGAFHTPFMHGAARQLYALCHDLTLQPPRLPVVSSMTGRLLTRSGDAGVHFALQLVKPVRWLAVMRLLQRARITHLIEAGPGGVLCQLAAGCRDWQVSACAATDWQPPTPDNPLAPKEEHSC